jgi:hypothetical protein
MSKAEDNKAHRRPVVHRSAFGKLGALLQGPCDPSEFWPDGNQEKLVPPFSRILVPSRQLRDSSAKIVRSFSRILRCDSPV